MQRYKCKPWWADHHSLTAAITRSELERQSPESTFRSNEIFCRDCHRLAQFQAFGVNSYAEIAFQGRPNLMPSDVWHCQPIILKISCYAISPISSSLQLTINANLKPMARIRDRMDACSCKSLCRTPCVCAPLIMLGQIDIESCVRHQPHSPVQQSQGRCLIQQSLGGDDKVCLQLLDGPGFSPDVSCLRLQLDIRAHSRLLASREYDQRGRFQHRLPSILTVFGSY